jgi:hypothetical protein
MTMTAVSSASARVERVNADERLVWLTLLALLGAGLILRGQVEGRFVHFSQAGIALVYPASWAALVYPASWAALADEETYQLLHVVDPVSSIQFPTSVRVRRIPFGDLGRAGSSLGAVALSWSARQGQEMPVYSVLQIVPAEARGRPAITIDYAYVPPPAMGAAAGSIPAVVRARDLLLQQGDAIVVLTFEAGVASYPQELAHWEQILASLEVK